MTNKSSTSRAMGFGLRCRTGLTKSRSINRVCARITS